LSSNSKQKQIHKSLLTKTLLVFFIFVSSTFFIHISFGATGERDPSCHVLEISENCDLSGIGHLLYGDAVVGGILALFFHHLAHKNQVRIDKIISSNEQHRMKRKDFAVFHLKSQITAMLFNLGRIKKLTLFHNDAINASFHPLTLEEKERNWKIRTMKERVKFEEEKLGRLLDVVRSTLVGAQDVMEPEVVMQIDGVITFVGEMIVEERKDETVEFVKYPVSKKKVLYLLEKLKSYSVVTHTFKKTKEAFEDEFDSTKLMGSDASPLFVSDEKE
jgi:hypothetical protein